MTQAVQILNSSFKRSRAGWAAAAALTAAIVLPGCTSQQLKGAGSSYLIVDALNASSGQEDKFSGVLESDVHDATIGVVSDVAKFDLRLGMKDPGSAVTPTVPTSNNWITVTRYHVRFIRSDGRNTQGVDVPYAFDGAATVTVREDVSTLVITLVRAQAKLEAPLMALRNLGGSVVISTIAEVTLFGTDQAGREISAVGRISVNFADYN